MPRSQRADSGWLFALQIGGAKTPKRKFFPSRVENLEKHVSKDHPYMVSALQGWRFCTCKPKAETARSRGFYSTRIAIKNAAGRERVATQRVWSSLAEIYSQNGEDAKARMLMKKRSPLSKRDPDIEKSADKTSGKIC